MQLHLRSHLVLLSLALGNVLAARADFEPILLTTNSYNYDIVIEKTAPPPAVCVTTASMEQGITNSGFTWFERGYLPDWPTTGIPEAGSLLPSDFSPDHQYRMPATYRGANAFLIDSTRSNGVIIIAAPTNCAILSFLTSSALTRTTIGYELRYVDGTTERGSFTSPNWYNDGDPAWAASGKVNVSTFSRSDLSSYNPRLYSVDVSVSDTISPLSSIGLSWISGNGHAVIFAVSAARVDGAVFVPLSIEGFNEDVVIEAAAVKPGFLETNTVATMESGTNNSGYTWYERGYNPAAPETGLPAAGSTLTSESDPTRRFQFAPSYTAPNAVLLDRSSNNAVMFLAAPARYSALSFLTASSGGTPAVSCIVRHADGSTETNSFVSGDWLGNSPPALTTHGRVNVSTKLIASQFADNPRLYAADVAITRQESPISRITLLRADASTAKTVVVFAVSGAPVGSVTPERPVLTIASEGGGKINFHSTRPGRLQSCPVLKGAATVWRDEGAIAQSLSLTRSPAEAVRFYRVLAQ